MFERERRYRVDTGIMLTAECMSRARSMRRSAAYRQRGAARTVERAYVIYNATEGMIGDGKSGYDMTSLEMARECNVDEAAERRVGEDMPAMPARRRCHHNITKTSRNETMIK